MNAVWEQGMVESDRRIRNNAREAVMGMEVFLIELHGGPSSYGEAKEIVHGMSNVYPDPEGGWFPGSTYYVFRDGTHTIEMELADAPVKLMCRFTLCHPPSVDAVFLTLVRELMLRLGMKVKILENIRPEHERFFSLQEFAEFSAIVRDPIATCRAGWIATFGDRQLGASSKEQFEEIILPVCKPQIEQPT
jgi:hypothetical protein